MTTRTLTILATLAVCAATLTGCATPMFTTWTDDGALYHLNEDGAIEFYSPPNWRPVVKWAGRWTRVSNCVVRAEVHMYRAKRVGEEKLIWEKGGKETCYIWLDPTPPPCRRFEDPSLAVRYAAYQERRARQHLDPPSVPPRKAYYIYGDVLMPGPYLWRDGLTITEVITEAGGFEENARATRVSVKRLEVSPGSTSQMSISHKTNILVDVVSIMKGEAPDMEIRLGDFIQVPSGSFW